MPRRLADLVTINRSPVPKPNGTPRDADCIIVLAFGYHGPKGENIPHNLISPGPMNEAIAKVAGSYSNAYNLPIIAQWETADVLSQGNLVERIEYHRIRDHYLDTYEVLAQAKKYMQQTGWKKAMVIGWYYRLNRSIWNAHTLGIYTIEPAGLLEALKEESKNWDNSVAQAHEQTTSFKAWKSYDWKARNYFWLMGKIQIAQPII